MKERPILFSGEMIRAIQNGRKTQTRRVIKPKWLPLVEKVIDVNKKWVWDTFGYELTTPYGKPGDQLWVRETFGITAMATASMVLDQRRQDLMSYKADNPEGRWCWKPSIHMPRWASRIQLEITNIRVERVQDISESNCFAEGTYGYKPFIDLWDSINAAKGLGWDANPWVWVIEFRRVEA